MGKRQRARARTADSFISPLLRQYAQQALKPDAVSLEVLVASQVEASRRSLGHAAVADPAPTPEAMWDRAALDASRLEFELAGKAWRRSDGKEAQVARIKFDRNGHPIYRFILPNGRSWSHHAATAFARWSPSRVYFPVDLHTGRNILPGAVG